jgi:hypothetical protein
MSKRECDLRLVLSAAERDEIDCLASAQGISAAEAVRQAVRESSLARSREDYDSAQTAFFASLNEVACFCFRNAGDDESERDLVAPMLGGLCDIVGRMNNACSLSARRLEQLRPGLGDELDRIIMIHHSRKPGRNP